MSGGPGGLPRWQTLTRWAAWACVAAIAPLSLTPAEAVARTGLGGHLEHAVAYAGTTFLVAAAYGGRARIVAGMLAYAAGLEFLQHFSPGRTPSLVDYTFSGMGIVAGTAAAILLHRCLVAPERA
jgi:VanZ family protein